jgi:outer membrane protein OmpA-like peptidoglycan-associated protein
MKARRSVFGLALLALATLASAPAKGDMGSAPIDLQTFRPAMDTKGYITLNGAQILAPLNVSFGLIGTGAWRPLKLESGDVDLGGGGAQHQQRALNVNYVMAFTLQGAIGLFATDHVGLELGLALPVGMVSGEGTPYEAGYNQGKWISGKNLSGSDDDRHYLTNFQGLGDVAVLPKLRILNPSRTSVGIAIIPGLILPTGDKKKFLGEGQVIFQPQAVIESEWGGHGVFRAAINLGARLRTGGTSQFADVPSNFNRPVLQHNPNDGSATSGDPIAGTESPGNTFKGIKVGNELLAGLGLSYGVVPFVFDLVAELYTFTGLDSKKLTFATDGTTVTGSSSMGPGGEAVAGFKAYLAPNSFFTAGGGYGVIPTGYGTSRGRFFAGIVFEPGAGDRDGDGLTDDVDKCPDDPEDFDDFEDEDGCPDLDNDQDGIPDTRDKCPNEPGPRENEGCPMHKVHDRDGDGIPDELDKCPDEPEDFDKFEDTDGCPDPDNDKDGIPDKNDLCPNDPEDKDGFEDEDGCPDPDNDHDRILDVNDKCPNEPETYNGFEDEDGCPDKGLVIVQRGKLEILDKIYFETDKDVIKEVSFPLLDAIAATIKGHPEIALIEIQGHADERGDDEHNLDLTDRRAHSVMRALEDRGVELGRLKARGYGETKPVCTQHNEDCWSKNRRVEFIIIKRVDDVIMQGDSGQ